MKCPINTGSCSLFLTQTAGEVGSEKEGEHSRSSRGITWTPLLPSTCSWPPILPLSLWASPQRPLPRTLLATSLWLSLDLLCDFSLALLKYHYLCLCPAAPIRPKFLEARTASSSFFLLPLSLPPSTPPPPHRPLPALFLLSFLSLSPFFSFLGI